MNFEDLREQLRERTKQALDQLQESEAYHDFHEKYQSLPVQTQKGLLWGGVGVFLFILLIVPIVILTSARSFQKEYNDQRNLMRDLFIVSRQIQNQPNIVPPISQRDLINQLERIFQNAGVEAEHVDSIDSYTVQTQESAYLPQGLSSIGLSARAEFLTLNQLTDIAFRIQTVHPSAKLLNIQIQHSDHEENYLNATFKLAVFSHESLHDENEQGSL